MRLVACICSLAALAWCQPENSRVDRVGDTGFLQLEADSLKSLSPREQALCYWLSQASIAINPIIYDQLSRFGLRKKRMLEMIVAHPEGVNPATYQKILAFTKLFWANRGNHNETTAQKFLPEFTLEDLRAAGLAAIQHGGGRFQQGGVSERDRRTAAVAVRSQFRTHDDDQESTWRPGHTPSQLEQFLFRCHARRSKNFHRTKSIEFPASESRRAFGRTGVSRGHARSTHSAGPLRGVFSKGQFLSG